MTRTYISHAVHQFSALETANFSPIDYSYLKFGSNKVAKRMGHELADSLFAAHAGTLLANRVVVVSSPYNYVLNAATMMTNHFVDQLNSRLVFAGGEHVEYTVVHRKVSYTNDYGFLSKEQRRELIDGDSFYFNREFVDGKLILFIDDVRITGTHEEKLKEVLARDNLPNEAMFLYYASLTGPASPDIEGRLNFSGVQSVADFVQLTKEDGHRMIVRAIKYVLGLPTDQLTWVINALSDKSVSELYHGCLAEGYYKLPQYQQSFAVVVAAHRHRNG